MSTIFSLFKSVIVLVFAMFLFGINSFAQTVTNGDFESWTGGVPDAWTLNSQGTDAVIYSQGVGEGITGDALEIIAHSDVTDYDGNFYTDVTDIEAGNYYDVSVSIKSNDDLIKIRYYGLQWLNASDNPIGSAIYEFSTNPDTEDTWSEFALSQNPLLAPTGAVKLRVNFRVFNNSTANWDVSSILLDDFTVVEHAFIDPGRTETDVTQDPGQTGGLLNYVFDPGTYTAEITQDPGEKVPWVIEESGVPPYSGNWVGVAIDFPDGYDGSNDLVALYIDGSEVDGPFLSAEEIAAGEIWYYFEMNLLPDASHTITIEWPGDYAPETFYINATGLDLEDTPSVQEAIDNTSMVITPEQQTNNPGTDITNIVTCTFPVFNVDFPNYLYADMLIEFNQAMPAGVNISVEVGGFAFGDFTTVGGETSFWLLDINTGVNREPILNLENSVQEYTFVYSGLTLGNYDITYSVIADEETEFNDPLDWYVFATDNALINITDEVLMNIPLNEPFEDDFTYFDNGTENNVDWIIESTIVFEGTKSVRNAYGASNNNSLVLVGPVDFTSVDNPVMSFSHIAKTEGDFDHCYIEVSIDDGNTWESLPEYTYLGNGVYENPSYNNPTGPCFDEDSYTEWGTGTQAPENTWWKTETFALLDYTNEDNVLIRFRLNSEGSVQRAGWYIDDISLYSEACLPPLNLAINNLNYEGGELSWLAGSANLWNIEIGLPGFTPGNSEELFAFNGVSSNPYTISGLSPETDYRLFIQTDCGVDGTSEWAGPLSFTTLEICPAPTNIELVSATTNSLQIGWEQPGGNGTWDLIWGEEGFNMALEGTSISDFSTNPVLIEGLSPQTEYDFYIRSDCGTGVNSELVGPNTFTTECGVFSVPLVENFDTWGTGSDAFPDCWQRPVTYGSSTIYPSIVNYSSSPSSPNCLRFQSATTEPTYVITPAFDEDINSLMVSFNLKREGTSSGTIQVGVMSNPDNLSTFEVVQTIDNTSTDWNYYEVMFDETSLSGINNYIAFRHNSNASNYYYWLDDVEVDLIPSCMYPTDLFVDNITGVSAMVNWTEQGTATEWDLLWGEAGFDPDTEGTLVTEINSIPYTLDVGIDDATYSVYVRSKCGEGDYSDWSMSSSFYIPPIGSVQIGDGTITSSSLPINAFYGYSYSQSIYYAEDFNNPGDNLMIDKIWYNYTWATSGDPDNEDWIIYMGTTENTALTDWVDISEFTEVFNGQSGLQYVSGTGWIEFQLEVPFPYNPDTDGNLIIAVEENSPNYSGSSDDFFSTNATEDVSIRYYSDGTNPDPYNLTVTGTPVDAFPNTRFSFIDMGSCAPPFNLAYGNLTETTAEITWSSFAGIPFYNIVYGQVGFNPDTEGTIVENIDNTTYLIEALTPGATYDVYIRSDCGSGDVSDWVGPVQFSTVPTCDPPSSVYVDDIDMDNANVYYTAEGTATEWDIIYGPEGFDPFSEGTLVDNTTDNPFNISGLDAVTSYDVYVRSDCGGDLSPWVGPATFTTLICDLASQCDFTINLQDSYGDGWNGAYLEVYQSGILVETNITISSGSSATLTGSLCDETYTEVVFYGGSYDYEVSFNIVSPYGATLYTSTAGDFSTTEDGTVIFSLWTHCTEPTCPEPSDLEVDAVYSFSADLSWTENGTATAWDLIFGTPGFDPFSEGTIAEDVSNPGTVTGLNAETDYEVYVRSDCGGETSYWVGPVIFTTLPSCPAPVDLIYTNIDGTIITIEWTEIGSAGTWDIIWGPEGFDIATGGTLVESIINMPYDLDVITDGSFYDIYVRANCGGGDISDWSAVLNVEVPYEGLVQIGDEDNTGQHLPIEPYYGYSYSQSIYYAEDFNSPGENQWIEKIWYNYSWSSSNDPDNEDWIIYMGTTANTALTDWIDISEFTEVFNGQSGLQYVSGTGWIEFTLDQPFIYNPDTDGNLIIAVEENSPSYSSSSDEFFVTDANSNVSIRYYSDGTNPDPYNLTVTGTLQENYPNTRFLFKDIPSCLFPAGIIVENITGHTALVSWNSNGTETTWNVIYGPNGFNPETEGSTEIANDMSFNITGLEPETDYQVYVQADCGGGDLSTLAGPVNFTTDVACPDVVDAELVDATHETITINIVSGGIETEWNVLYGLHGFISGEGTEIIVTENPFTISGLNTDTQYDFYIQANCGVVDGTSNWEGPFVFSTTVPCPDAWNITINDIIYDGGVLSWEHSSAQDTWDIEVGLDGFTPGTGNEEFLFSGVQDNPYIITGLTPETEYDVYIMADCGALGYSNWVGPVDLNTLNPCPDVWDIIVSDIGEYGATVAWSSIYYQDTWNIEVGLPGFTPGNGEEVVQEYGVTDNPFILTGLDPDTEYEVYIMADCDALGESDWVSPSSTFSTIPTCIEPTDVIITNISFESATVSWTPVGSANTWNIEVGLQGFTPFNGEEVVSNTITGDTFWDITGLNNTTSYDVYIQSDCGAGDLSYIGGPYAFITSDPYCNAGPSYTSDSNVEQVDITGENDTEISYTGCPGVTYVQTLTQYSVDVYQGQTYSLAVLFGSCSTGNYYYSGAGQVWIDWDQNYTYDTEESIGTSSGVPGSAPWNAPVNFDFEVPADAELGVTRMRVMQREGGSLPLDPCATYSWGSVMDFSVNVLPTPPNTEADILTYTFGAGVDYQPATIDPVEKTVFVWVNEGTDLTSLVAEFTLSDGANASIAGTPQVSGETENDFSMPITYLVTAEDEVTSNEWEVTVSIWSGIDAENGITNLNLYPNPSDGIINLSLINYSDEFTYTISDVEGRAIITNKVNVKGKFTETIDLDVAAGSYYITIENDKFKRTQKFIIKR